MSLSKAYTLFHEQKLIRRFISSRNTILTRWSSIATTKSQEPCKDRTIVLDPCCKIAVILGGAEGIGLAAGRQLLCAKANHVLLLGLDTVKGLEAVNTMNCSFGKNKCTFIKCDIRDKNETLDILQKIKVQFKTVEIFVNTAGIWDETKWEEELRTNLMGTINLNLAVMKIFPNSNAVVINFAGIHGLQPFPPSPIFSAEHAGIIQFSQNLGHPQNFKRTGLRVMALCTGTTTCTEFLNGVEGKMLTPEMGSDLHGCLNESQKQKPDVCGKAVIELIKHGVTGSVWIIEGSRLVYLEMPDWRKHRILVSQFT